MHRTRTLRPVPTGAKWWKLSTVTCQHNPLDLVKLIKTEHSGIDSLSKNHFDICGFCIEMVHLKCIGSSRLWPVETYREIHTKCAIRAWKYVVNHHFSCIAVDLRLIIKEVFCNNKSKPSVSTLKEFLSKVVARQICGSANCSDRSRELGEYKS